MAEEGAGSPSASNMPVGPARIDGDRLSVDDLRDISVAEYDKEHGKPKEEKEKAPKPKPKPEKKAPAAEDDDDDADDDDLDEEEEDEPKKTAPRGPEEKPEQKTEKKAKEKTKDAEEDDGDEETDPEGEDEEEEGTGKRSKYLTAKSADGKAYKVPKDALFDVKINGKIEQIPASELLAKAGGNINLSREHSALGNAKKQFQQAKVAFEQQAQATNENLQMLKDIADKGTPEDFAQYYGMLTGEDPHKVLQGIVERAIQYAEHFAGMTDRERHLYNENRKYSFQQNLAARSQQQTATQQAQYREQQAIMQKLQAEGLTPDDFRAAHEDVQARIQSGELNGNYTAMDIAEYSVAFKHHRNVQEAVTTVDDSRADDGELVGRISRAVLKAEAATGEKFSRKEIRSVVRAALEDEQSGLRESLNRKVDRVERSGKTNSQSANSRNQGIEGAGPLTLRDHYDRLWGGD